MINNPEIYKELCCCLDKEFSDLPVVRFWNDNLTNFSIELKIELYAELYIKLDRELNIELDTALFHELTNI